MSGELTPAPRAAARPASPGEGHGQPSVRRKGTWTVVEMGGGLDLCTAPQLRSLLVGLIEAGQHRLILDLDRVDLLDSTGLGVLVAALRRVRAQRGELRLVCSRDGVLKPLRVTGLLAVFAVHPDLPAALAAP